MMRILIGLITLFLSGAASAQPLRVQNHTISTIDVTDVKVSAELFTRFIAVQPLTNSNDRSEQYEDLQSTTQHLARKLRKSKSTKQFLKYFFYHIHRNYLKQYQSYATLGDVLTNGRYDCVSGTALYALLLEALQIQFSVREMTYHTYLEVPLEGGIAIIESTDPLAGFISTPSAISKRLAQYQSEDIDGTIYSKAIQASVGLEELLGLSYFNAAVAHYNQYKFSAARQYLRHAIRWYPTERMYAFQAVIEAVATR